MIDLTRRFRLSRYDFMAAQRLSCSPPFYARVAALMREADTGNLERLRAAFPGLWEQYQARYDAPGGYLEGER